MAKSIAELMLGENVTRGHETNPEIWDSFMTRTAEALGIPANKLFPNDVSLYQGDENVYGDLIAAGSNPNYEFTGPFGSSMKFSDELQKWINPGI